MKSKIIVLEGGEGCGKSTLCASLQQHFPDFVFTAEPKNTEYSRACREVFLQYWNSIDSFSALCLMWSQRRDHWVELIIPTIESGNSVVCDRSDGSSYAYQVFGQGQSTVDLFWQLRKTCFAQFSPDLYIYLDIDPLVSLERRRQDTSKEMTAFDHAEIEKHHNVRAGFKEFISNPDIPGDTIDASQSREAVLADAIRLISVIL